MKNGMTPQALAQELQRQAASKKDFVAPASQLRVNENRELSFSVQGNFERLPIRRAAHTQLADFVGIPQKYYDRMLQEDPTLWSANVNTWLGRSEDRRLVRTLDREVRAIPSDGYRIIDNYDVVQAVLPAILDSGARIVSADITERSLYIQLVTDRLTGEVARGDVVQAGIVLRNSETGFGAFDLQHLVYRLVCLNGMISGSVFRRAHVGGRIEKLGVDEEAVAAYFRTETRELSDRALFSQLRDVAAGVFSQGAWDALLGKLREKADPALAVRPSVAPQVVERIAKRFELNDGERQSVLDRLLNGGDFTPWGVANAITGGAHEAPSYDRSVELEQLGARVIELPRRDWELLSAA
jgi:hypothetical protein